MPHAFADHYGMPVPSVPHRQGGLTRLHAKVRRQVDDWRHARRRGHQLQMVRQALAGLPEHERFREIASMFAIIALAAKLAQAGGEGIGAAVRHFSECFPQLEHDVEKVKLLLESAGQDHGDALVYARRIAALYPAEEYRVRLEDIFSRLVKITALQGQASDSQSSLLHSIGAAFGIRGRTLAHLLRGQKPHSANPYVTLQAKRGWSDRQIRQAYLRLVRDCHPDTVQARGGSAAALQAAGEELALLNAAYSLICRERGLKG